MYKVVILILVLVVANAAFIYAGGASWVESRFMASPEPTLIPDPVLVDVFVFTLEEEVRKKRGLPEEGYQPDMFLEVFPGLTATDFDGVEASVGRYTFTDGRLSLEVSDGGLVHETPGAISRQGMETLLYNIAKRTGIDFKTTGTITDIVRVITES